MTNSAHRLTRGGKEAIHRDDDDSVEVKVVFAYWTPLVGQMGFGIAGQMRRAHICLSRMIIMSTAFYRIRYNEAQSLKYVHGSGGSLK